MIDQQTLRSARYLSTTESTNSTALQFLEQHGSDSQCLPKLVLADQQTAGRGRQGNQWHSDSDALTFSLVVECFDEDAFSLLSLAAGVATARALEFLIAPAKVALKWPNDIGSVSLDSVAVFQKVAGILIEANATKPSIAVIGIGINLNVAPRLPATNNSSQLSHRPACLSDLAGRPMDRATTLACVIESLGETLAELHAAPSQIVDQYRERCILSRKRLAMKQGDQILEGECTGVLDDGSLELIINGKQTAFRSGEVHSIRRS